MDKIIAYSKQDEYDLVNSGQDCMGWTAVDQAGKRVGQVTEMLINTETEKVDSIIIDGEHQVTAQDFALRDNQVVVRGVRGDGGELGGVQNYQDGEVTGTDDALVEGAGAKHVAGLTMREAAEGETVLPIIEEQFKVGKRTVETGGARVRTIIEEVPVAETVSLREENVTVERRPVNRLVENAPAAFEEGTIEVTEMAEVPVAHKEARVVEEVVVSKDVTEHQETVRDTVKRTEVDVDEVDRKLSDKR